MTVNELRLKNNVPWTDDIKWKPELNLKASSYHPRTLFDGLTPVEQVPPNPNDFLPGEFIDSPNHTWRYSHNKLHRGHSLMTWNGSRFGSVVFDGDVLIPAVYEKVNEASNFNRDPWMSLTPAEYLSFRGGIQSAHGKVIIAGLGLGHLLIEVSKKKTVNEIILVEISEEIVDWLWSQIKQYVTEGKLTQVIIGDAYKEIPKLKADIALIDIFLHYGNNNREVTKIQKESPYIEKFWGWGTAKI